MDNQYVANVVDLTNPSGMLLQHDTNEEAVKIVKSGDVDAIRRIDGQFALVSVEEKQSGWPGLWPSVAVFHCQTAAVQPDHCGTD